MKKVISILCVAALAVSLTACKKEGENKPNTTNPPGQTQSGSSGTTGGSSNQSDFDKSKTVTILAREDGSGTKSAFMEIIGHKGKADPATVIIQTGTAGILAEVKGNKTAIAYESLGFVTDEVKKLKVDGVEATTDKIKDGTYKIARPLSVVYKESTLEDPVNKAFFDFIQSKAAQEIIAAEGFVSTVEGAKEYTIDPALEGTIEISGSTSLQPLIAEKLAPAFEELQSKVKVNVSGGGSGTGYKDAENGTSVFGMISAEFNDADAPSCTHFEVCKDGIAVIVNKDNPLESISLDDLKGLYDEESADSPKWSEFIS